MDQVDDNVAKKSNEQKKSKLDLYKNTKRNNASYDCIHTYNNNFNVRLACLFSDDENECTQLSSSNTQTHYTTCYKIFLVVS